MPPRPKKKQACPVCRQQMSWFGDHWLCTNIKLHDKITNPKMGTVVPFRRRKRA